MQRDLQKTDRGFISLTMATNTHFPFSPSSSPQLTEMAFQTNMVLLEWADPSTLAKQVMSTSVAQDIQQLSLASERSTVAMCRKCHLQQPLQRHQQEKTTIASVEKKARTDSEKKRKVAETFQVNA